MLAHQSAPHDLCHWCDGSESVGRMCWLTSQLQMIYSIGVMAHICMKQVLAHQSASHHLCHWCDGSASVGRMCWLISQPHTIYTIGVMAQHL